MKYKVYVVEDEKDLRALVESYLEKEGWQVKTFDNGRQAIESIPEQPHLWILDVMLPEVNGFEILKQIKEVNKLTPVIFISARNQDFDRILGLEMGSDDYLAKPFSPRELVVRVRIVLSRVYGGESDKGIQYEGYTIELSRRAVLENGKEIGLTAKEFDLLEYFVSYRGQALSREQIIQAVWNESYYGSDRVVDDLLRRLRRKMTRLDIETIYGYGYRLK